MKKENQCQEKHNERGEELGDPIPMEAPLDFRPPPSIQDMIRAAIRTEMSEAAAAQGEETFEEANDFDTGEDDMPRSAFELSEDEDFARGEAEVLDRARQDIEHESRKEVDDDPEPQPRRRGAKGKAAPKPRGKAAPRGGARSAPRREED